jgi:hypothetical protein
MFYLNTKHLLRIKWKIKCEKFYYFSVMYCTSYDSHAFFISHFPFFPFPHRYGLQLPVFVNVLAFFRMITEVSKAL